MRDDQTVAVAQHFRTIGRPPSTHAEIEAGGAASSVSARAFPDLRDGCKLANDPGHKKNVARLAQSGANVTMARSLIQRIGQN